MKFWRTGILSVLSAAMLLSMVSCGMDGGGSSSDTVSESTSSELTLENKQVKFMAHWPMNPAEGEEDRPELKLFKEKYGGEVVDVPVTWEERLDAVMTAAMSDDCPDLTVYWAELMPKGYTNGLYREIDDLIDLNGPGWKDLKPLLDLYMYNGKHYLPSPTVTDSGVLIYNEDMIEQYNLDDPRELYREGKWTWDAMLEMMKEFSDPNALQGDKFGRYGIDGYSVAYGLTFACGVPFVSLEDGKLKNNIMDPAIERAMNFVQEIAKAGVVFPMEQNDWKTDPTRVASGKILFEYTGMWDFPNYVYGSYKMGDKASFVPIPRDPDADAYYRGAGGDAHMVFGAAKNLDGVRAWQECRMLVNHDPEYKKENEALMMDQEKGSGMTQEDVDFYNEITDMSTFKPILDWSGGLNVDGVSGTSATADVWWEATPWATVREEFKPMFDNAIQAINDSL